MAKQRPLLERINERREVRGPDECWPRTRGCKRITFGPNKWATEIRRAVWFLEHGSFPDYYQHLEVSCGNCICLNPKHIYFQTEEQRFWSKVDKSGGDRACWLWTAARTRRGYGVFHFNKKSDGSEVATRYAWHSVTGETLPTEIFLCHHCDNPPCVNPSHLFKGSAKDNNDDMWRKGRGSCGPKHAEIMRQARAPKAAPSGGLADGK